MRFARLPFALAAIAPGLALGDASRPETAAVFSGHGVVEAVDLNRGWLTLSHDEIKGCMPAMEMVYRVRAPEGMKGLRRGDVVDFTIEPAHYVIQGVTVTARAR